MDQNTQSKELSHKAKPSTKSDGEFVDDLYRVLLNRAPQQPERAHWIESLQQMSDRAVFYKFVGSKEFKEKHRVRAFYPPGHFYSPIVDPEIARKYIRTDLSISPERLSGITIDLPKQVQFWERNRDVLASTNFSPEPCPESRYFINNPSYPVGDATILRAMIHELKPRHLIEIGSGYSSACLLDACDEFGLGTHFTFIDPYPQRLRSILTQEDACRVTIKESPVQDIPLDDFRRLGASDILLIDSTHVLKSGSDVHYELFEVLPSLEPGVVIHFHDIQYPFEYPKEWLFDKNFSWNEIYALRAFLFNNAEYEILFFTNLFGRAEAERIRNTYPPFLLNPGGSLWVRKRKLRH